MNNLCIIPARGGSKRIPQKNRKDFLGKPIISYSIETAQKTGLFNEIMVSTDDEKIKEIALQYGAKVPFMRSNKNSDDYASTMDVLKEVLAYYDQEKPSGFDYLCCFYPCSPLTSPELIQKAFNQMIEHDFDSVFPVIPFSFPIQRAVKIVENKLQFFYPENETKRSQDLEKSYHDAGQFYWLKSSIVRSGKSIQTRNSGTVVISELEGQDIDHQSDWEIAKIKYQLLQSAGKIKSE